MFQKSWYKIQEQMEVIKKSTDKYSKSPTVPEWLIMEWKKNSVAKIQNYVQWK